MMSYKDESQVINTLYERGKISRVYKGVLATYRKSGSFTTVLVTVTENDKTHIGLGSAKKNPNDKNTEQVGEQVAFFRAVLDLDAAVTKYEQEEDAKAQEVKRKHLQMYFPDAIFSLFTPYQDEYGNCDYGYRRRN